MGCLYCKGDCVKYGAYADGKQRYKCKKCNKTFSVSTIESFSNEKDKRLVLHLILAGCSKSEIATELGIEEKTIEKWINLHLRGRYTYLPRKPLLAIATLLTIYRAIEKSRISKINLRKPRRRRFR